MFSKNLFKVLFGSTFNTEIQEFNNPTAKTASIQIPDVEELGNNVYFKFRVDDGFLPTLINRYFKLKENTTLLQESVIDLKHQINGLLEREKSNIKNK